MGRKEGYQHFRPEVVVLVQAVLRIRIRMDPDLLPGSGPGIIVPDSDPAKNERTYK